MSEREAIDLTDLEPVTPDPVEQPPRENRPPLSMGSARPVPAPAPGEGRRPSPPQPIRTATESKPAPTGIQRAVNVLRSALPFVQRLLPLFDGEAPTATSHALTPKPAPRPQHESALDLVPIKIGLTQLEARHRELREQVMEQNTSINRVADQLDMVREATDRNTLEQQELLEDLKSFGSKVKIWGFLLLALVAAALALNLFLFLRLQHILP